jgi:hypothetical protein
VHCGLVQCRRRTRLRFFFREQIFLRHGRLQQLFGGAETGHQRAADAPQQQRLEQPGSAPRPRQSFAELAGVLIGRRHVGRHLQRVFVGLTMQADADFGEV